MNEPNRLDAKGKVTRDWISWSDKMAKESGFIDWNTLSMDQLVSYLERKHYFGSSGESLAINKLIEFYKKYKENEK